MSRQVWCSAGNGDAWFSLDDDGSLVFNQALPPAVAKPGEPGKRMPRTVGVGVKLGAVELEALALAASEARSLIQAEASEE